MPIPEKQLWSRQVPAGSLWVALLFVVLCGMVVGNFWILGWEPELPEPEPLRFEALPCDVDAVPDAIVERLGATALGQLQALNDQRASNQTRAVNPVSGARLVPTALGTFAAEAGPALPTAMLERLCAAAEVPDGEALGMRLVQRAEQSVRDPAERIGTQPWLRAHIRDQVLRGAAAQLEAIAATLVEAPPLGRRPVLVIRGQARQVSTWVIGHEHAAAREAATFDAWTTLTQEALGAERFELALEPGRAMATDDPLSRSVGVSQTWVEGWFDWEAWFRAIERRESPAIQPFFELGRLQALQLLNEAGLVELVFLGHGIEVDAEAHADARHQPFAMGPVGRGDEHQEVLNLRAGRQGFTLRYGLTLDARAPFWAASCSNRQGGETRPDQSTTAVAFLLANGWYPDAASLDPFVFGSYRDLQAALLEAEDPMQAGQAIRAAVRAQVERLAAPGELRAILPLGQDLTLLRAGGSETPDLLLIGDPAWRPSVDDALRITLATSGWRMLRPLPGSGELVSDGPWDPCTESQDCLASLDALLPQARRYVQAGLPPADASARYQVGGLLRKRWVEPVPDATNRFLRIGLLDSADPSVILALDDALRHRFDQARARRRIQGWVFPAEPSPHQDEP